MDLLSSNQPPTFFSYKEYWRKIARIQNEFAYRLNPKESKELLDWISLRLDKFQCTQCNVIFYSSVGLMNHKCKSQNK